MAGELDAKDTPMEFVGTEDDQSVLRFTYDSRQEAYEAKRERMFSNRTNYDTHNLKGDFTHKKKGQSKEFLPKQRMAVEQISSFISQALIDAGEWFSIECQPGVKNPKIHAHEMKLILESQLEKNNFPAFIVDSLKLGILGCLMISKVSGEMKEAASFEVKEDVDSEGNTRKTLWRNTKKVWQLKLSLVRQEDWFPDPTGQELFHVEQIEMDLHKVRELARGPNAIYDMDVVSKIVGGFEDLEQEARKARETDQLMTFHTARKRVRIWECFGDILDPSSGDVLYKNVMWTVCNDRYLIQRPTPNPFWHNEMPYVVSPIVRGASPTVWHIALADAPTNLNLAMNELYNLQLDTGMMATWGIRQFRPSWCSDDTKYADGIPPGETIEVNDSCPPGAKVLEPVQTAVMTPESMQVYNQTNAEFQQASMTNDLRMGVMPQRDVKATEVVEASQTITSMFTGIAKTVEDQYIVKNLRKMWLTIAQHIKDMDVDELKAILGEDRAVEILAMSSAEIFQATVKGYQFKVFGISEALSRMKDFRKMTALLQTIGGNETMTEAFIQKYDFGMLLQKIMRSLDIDVEELEVPPEEKAAMQASQSAQAPGGSPAGGPNVQSQIPQAGGNQMGSEGPTNQPAALIQQGNYPASRALQAEGR